MLELYVLICSILLLLLIVSYKTTEPFDTQKTDYNLISCPSGYSLFYDKSQSTMCCDGEVNGKMCVGKQCLLTGSSTEKSCTSVVVEDYKHKSDEFCPSSMSSYYENRTQKTKGCTSGILNQTMDGPNVLTQPQCKIYDTLNANINALDSCSNQKEMDAFPCFGKNCVKTLSQSVPNSPVLITISFEDNNGIQRSVHTRKSMQRFLDATQPNWRDKGMDLSKNIAIAEVAKAVYIDKTMSKDDVQN